MKVLLVTRSDDNECVDRVAHALEARRATPLRLDTDLYPQAVRLTTWVGPGARRTLEVGRRTHALDGLGALWYRRFFAGGRLSPSLGDLRAPAVEESRRTLYGTLAALGCFQLDPLPAVRKADHKELQLRLAAGFGLDVPRTLFSNAPAEVRRFFKACRGQAVTKMQSSFAVYREGVERVVFTTALSPADLRDLDGLSHCPMTFQERIPKALELRATVVGRRVFTAAVDSQASGKSDVDWRRDGLGLLEAWERYQLPPPVERALLRLTAAFGLEYAAADFIVTPRGRHVFLEINAGGEFFWLERKPGLPISAALAEVLTDPRARSARR